MNIHEYQAKELLRAAGAPVVCETPGGADAHLADFAWLRERL